MFRERKIFSESFLVIKDTMLNLLWSLSCFVGLSWTRAKFYVNPSTNRIVDNHGRERIFHGDNVVMKTAPFVPITTHFDARFHLNNYPKLQKRDA